MDLDKVERAFSEALELQGEAQQRYLVELRERDPETATHVEALLQSGDDHWLSEPVAKVAQSLGATAADHWLGRSLGPYVIAERIAEGGMGAVFRATRSHSEFEQTVAIKVMGSQTLHANAIAQFKAERQILAGLSHPYIAQLHDGGASAEGLPYLVMEYIDGVAIDAYCDAESLDIPGRLGLFLKVCEAVDYAHRSLVVHRDIKPANILVTSDGTPKLLDFGIAKLLADPRLDQTQALTQANARALTVAYASPEQVSGEPITTATDVYSLGVLLYKLLSGQMPYALPGSYPGENEKVICETDPPRPSTVVLTGDTTGRASIERQAASLRALQRRLSGDLDNIVLKMLAKEPQRRYLSVRAVIDDIERYQQQQPILARPASFGYILRRFVARHRLPVVVGSVSLVTLAVVVTGYTRELGVQRDAATEQARVSREAANFVSTLFKAANPKRTNPATVSPRSLLDAGRERIDAELAGAPAIRGRLLGVLAEAYEALGVTDESIELAQAALAVQREIAPSDVHGIAVAKARVAQQLFRAGHNDTARPLFEEALGVLEQNVQLDISKFAQVRNQYGVLLNRLREPDAAEVLFREQLALADAEPTFPPGLYGAALTNLADSLQLQSRDKESLDLMLQAEAHYQAVGGHSEYDASIMDFTLASAYLDFEAFDKALVRLNRVVDVQTRLLGESHRDTGVAFMTRSSAYFGLDRWDEAEQDLLRGREVLTKAMGAEHEDVGLAHHHLGSLRWRGRKDFDGALVAYGDALRVYEARLVEAHPLKVYTINAMGGVKREQGRSEEALKDLQQGLRWAADSLPPDHQQVVYAYQEIGLTQRDRGEFGLAAEAFEKGISLARRDGSYLYTIRPTMEPYIEMLVQQGKLDRAAELQTQLKELEQLGSLPE